MWKEDGEAKNERKEKIMKGKENVERRYTKNGKGKKYWKGKGSGMTSWF